MNRDPRVLEMLAACLPVVGVAVRTLHTVHEFSRNALRFESTSGELEQLARELEAKSGPRAKLEVLHRVEGSLRAERREWMRLMRGQMVRLNIVEVAEKYPPPLDR